MGVNVGCDRVRFPAPVRVDTRIRGRGEVFSAEPARLGGADKPDCVVETISRLLFDKEDNVTGSEEVTLALDEGNRADAAAGRTGAVRRHRDSVG